MYALSELETRPGTVNSVEIRGTVKWFNVVKGYGFLTPDDGSADVFLHLTVLRATGHERLVPGTTVTCEAVKGAKGMQVLRVLEVDVSTAVLEADYEPVQQRAPQEAEPVGPAGDFVLGTVKWFNPHKGYGFVCPDEDQTIDVFVHMVTLRRAGVESLITGQSVEIRIAEGTKGRQATEIRILSAPPPESSEPDC